MTCPKIKFNFSYEAKKMNIKKKDEPIHFFLTLTLFSTFERLFHVAFGLFHRVCAHRADHKANICPSRKLKRQWSRTTVCTPRQKPEGHALIRRVLFLPYSKATYGAPRAELWPTKSPSISLLLLWHEKLSRGETPQSSPYPLSSMMFLNQYLHSLLRGSIILFQPIRSYIHAEWEQLFTKYPLTLARCKSLQSYLP